MGRKTVIGHGMPVEGEEEGGREEGREGRREGGRRGKHPHLGHRPLGAAIGG